MPDGIMFSGAAGRVSTMGMLIFDPSAANLSASSLPLIPLWPFTQTICVLLLRNLIHAVMFLKRVACLENSHPWSSHFSRFLVRPLIAYIESVWITIAWSGGGELITRSIAHSSHV